VDLMHLSKAACAAQTAPTFVSYPHTTSCLSSSSGTRGFCLVSVSCFFLSPINFFPIFFKHDTGGPVVFTFVSELTISLLGVTSIYQGCPSTYPMAYTRVGPYLKWIKSKVSKLL
jgi:secreted trypsin-like serine protease